MFGLRSRVRRLGVPVGATSRLKGLKLSVGLVLGLVVLNVGCAPVKRRGFEEPSTEYSYHTVMYSGETLSIIAKWYTGQAGNWEALLDHNPEVDPRRLRIGDLVKIPQELLIRDESMPKKFVEKSNAKVVTKAPAKPVEGGVVEEAVAATKSAPAPSPVEAAAAAVERAASEADATAARNEARTKTRDELLQELLQDQ